VSWRRTAGALALLVPVALAGCTARPGRTAKARPAKTIRVANVFARIDANAASLRSLRALASIELHDGGRAVHGRQVVLLAPPTRLRFDVLGPFGVVLQVTTDGERVRAFDRGNKTFYDGRARAANLARFTRIDLRVREVVGLLLGTPVAKRDVDRATVDYEAATGLWRVTSPLEGGGVEHLWVEAESLRPLRCEVVAANGVRRYDATFGEHRTIDDVTVPLRVTLSAPSSEIVIALSYSDIELNPPLSEELFRFEPPAGATRVDLDATAGTDFKSVP